MLSEELVEVFRKEVKRLLKLYGLSSWDVAIETCHRHEVAAALVAADYPARAASIMVDVDHEEDELQVRKSAMHEVLHLLFTDMREAYREQKEGEGARVESAEHGVINALINAEYGDAE